MDCDQLLMSEDFDQQDLTTKKERLLSLAACCKTKPYLGVQFSIEEIQEMPAHDILKYYSRYETLLGSKMVKSVGQTVLSLYVKLISQFASIDSEENFSYDLLHDPIIMKTLESFGCDLYYRFGSLLAPLTMGLITCNHINLNNNIKQREDEPTRDSTGESTAELREDTSNN